MTFGLAPPKNVSTLFGIGSRVFLRLILFKLEWAFAWLFMLFGTTEMTMSLTKQKNTSFCSLFLWYPLDLYVVLSSTRGAAGRDGFWVQPVRDGSSEFITPVWVVVVQ
jgi:hypothetical protein